MAGIMGWWKSQVTGFCVPSCWLIVLGIAGIARGQCTTPPCPSGCPTICDVTTQAQLQAALDCLGGPGNSCSHIRIPSGTTLIATSTFGIGSVHNGLHLEIQGVIRWEQEWEPDQVLFNLVGCSNVTIDGNGTTTAITSIFEPVQQLPDHEVATAIRISAGASHITIQNLTVTKMTSVIKVEGSGASDLTVINVHGRNLGDYGIWTNNRITGRIENCSMTEMHDEHGFRIYGDNITILNCRAYGTEASVKSGLWAVEGENFTVDRFSSDKVLVFGPNYVFATSDTLTNVVARELHGLDDLPPQGSNPSIWIEMGTQGMCMLNCCIRRLWVGRSSTAHSLRLQDTNWDELQHADTGQAPPVLIQTGNPLLGPNVGPINYNYCFADIDRNEAVDVDDLVAVILAWGACPGPPSGFSEPNPPCAPDIYPRICGDGNVDVDDLIEVILTWGACPAHPTCGTMSIEESEYEKAVPETVQDCYDHCIARHPEGGQAFIECYNACLEALEFLP